MSNLDHAIAAVGLACLLTYSGDGPVAWVRDRYLQPVLGRWSGGMFMCLRCTSVWGAAVIAVARWLPLDGSWGVLTLWPVLMAPALATPVGALYAIAAEARKV